MLIVLGLDCKTKVSRMSILEHWKTCPSCYSGNDELCSGNERWTSYEMPTPIDRICTTVYKFDKFNELFFLVGIKIGERIVFLVKYGGVETRYIVELKLSGVEKCISYQLDAVPLSTDPDSALREGNAMEVHQSALEKITRKPEGGFELVVEMKVTKL